MRVWCLCFDQFVSQRASNISSVSVPFLKSFNASKSFVFEIFSTCLSLSFSALSSLSALSVSRLSSLSSLSFLSSRYSWQRTNLAPSPAGSRTPSQILHLLASAWYHQLKPGPSKPVLPLSHEFVIRDRAPADTGWGGRGRGSLLQPMVARAFARSLCLDGGGWIAAFGLSSATDSAHRSSGTMYAISTAGQRCWSRWPRPCGMRPGKETMAIIP